jgi:2-amino-4-hydroxy-6-hydroxymethyldihydropteridine diphosphokinase
MNTDVSLLLGTNMGDRNKNLNMAIDAIDVSIGKIKKKSAVYRTEAWGKTDQPPFYNQVIVSETSMDAQALLDGILSIEKKMGRQRDEKWGKRIIDIDILFFGDEIIESKFLLVPHPQIPYRRFTLVPLNEIIPHFIHPKLQKKISELLTACDDPLEVVKISGPVR